MIDQQKTFRIFYIKFVYLICNINLPNFDNKIRDGFILNYLNQENRMNHCFPEFIEEDGVLKAKFIRLRVPEMNENFPIQDLDESKATNID